MVSPLSSILSPAQKRDHYEFGTRIWIETYMGMDYWRFVHQYRYSH
jgi:hypothetical protein